MHSLNDTIEKMTTLEELKKEIDEIKSRNKRVEADKAWETSGTTFVNAIVPTIGFFLSTLTIPWFKSWWLRNYEK